VAHFQIQGGDQEPILHSPPLDIVTTSRALADLPQAVRLRSGNYVAIPKEHASDIKDEIKNLKIIDGFLVPKEPTTFDVYDQFSGVVPKVSCLSLNIRVSKLG
jgi:hypothetical protein